MIRASPANLNLVQFKSFGFINQINTQNVRNSRMCSLDVSSLFTNVPLLETIDYICDFIDHSDLTFDVPTVGFKRTPTEMHL